MSACGTKRHIVATHQFELSEVKRTSGDAAACFGPTLLTRSGPPPNYSMAVFQWCERRHNLRGARLRGIKAMFGRSTMQTRIDEIGAGMYRLSIFVPEIPPPAGFTFNHF